MKIQIKVFKNKIEFNGVVFNKCKDYYVGYINGKRKRIKRIKHGV